MDYFIHVWQDYRGMEKKHIVLNQPLGVKQHVSQHNTVTWKARYMANKSEDRKLQITLVIKVQMVNKQAKYMPV